MFQSEQSLATHQTETTEPYISYTQNTGTTDSTQPKNIIDSLKHPNPNRIRRYIKPLATINDISFVVIDKNILEQLDIQDSTSIELEEEITQDRKGILLRIRNTTTA